MNTDTLAPERVRYVDRKKPEYRYKKVCCVCGKANGSPHHVIPRDEGGMPIFDNIVWLCQEHHDEVEGPSVGAWDRIHALQRSYKSSRHSGPEIEEHNADTCPGGSCRCLPAMVRAYAASLGAYVPTYVVPALPVMSDKEFIAIATGRLPAVEPQRTPMIRCPLCPHKCHTRTGLEDHVWHQHENTYCCTRHKSSKATSPDIPKCSGGMAMAACCLRGIEQNGGVSRSKPTSAPAMGTFND